MNLELFREKETANGGILGSLYVDGQFFGYTLENAAAAIPAGIFSMFARFSPKFNSFNIPLTLLLLCIRSWYFSSACSFISEI